MHLCTRKYDHKNIMVKVIKLHLICFDHWWRKIVKTIIGPIYNYKIWRKSVSVWSHIYRRAFTNSVSHHTVVNHVLVENCLTSFIMSDEKSPPRRIFGNILIWKISSLRFVASVLILFWYIYRNHLKKMVATGPN